MQNVYGTNGDLKNHTFKGYRRSLSTAGNGFYLLRVLFYKQSQQEGSKSQNC